MACKCGGNRFVAHQRVYVDVVVDGDNYFLENCGKDTDDAIYEAEDPYGPYTCLKCEKVDDDLPQHKFLFFPGLNKWVEVSEKEWLEAHSQIKEGGME